MLTAFAANQRDEVRDLHDVAAALTAQPGMKQQTFVAGITAKGNGDCFLSEERHTALSGGGGMPGQGYAFLSIRLEDTSILDFLRYAIRYFLLGQQTYAWGLCNPSTDRSDRK